MTTTKYNRCVPCESRNLHPLVDCQTLPQYAIPEGICNMSFRTFTQTHDWIMKGSVSCKHSPLIPTSSPTCLTLSFTKVHFTPIPRKPYIPVLCAVHCTDEVCFTHQDSSDCLAPHHHPLDPFVIALSTFVLVGVAMDEVVAYICTE